MRTGNIAIIFFILLMSVSCTRETNSNQNTSGKTQAYIPKYLSVASVSAIKIDSPKTTTEAGKVYVFANYLFQNDINKGIHIIDISSRSNPKKIAFIDIPYSTEIAVKGNYLYTNNLSDLVTFDISNPAFPVLKSRVKDVFPLPNQKYPPFTGVYFECPDGAKGIVVKWELGEVENPKCRR